MAMVATCWALSIGSTLPHVHQLVMQFDIIMLDVAAPDPTADPGTLSSIPAQFLSANFVLEGLQRRLRWGPSLHSKCSLLGSRERTKHSNQNQQKAGLQFCGQEVITRQQLA